MLLIALSVLDEMLGCRLCALSLEVFMCCGRCDVLCYVICYICPVEDYRLGLAVLLVC